jgi:hypothetical protein
MRASPPTSGLAVSRCHCPTCPMGLGGSAIHVNLKTLWRNNHTDRNYRHCDWLGPHRAMVALSLFLRVRWGSEYVFHHL